jgi:hypothetical protein
MKNNKSTTCYQQPQQQDGNMSKANRKMNKKNLQSKQNKSTVRTSSINSQNSNNNNSYNTPVTAQPFSDTLNKNSHHSPSKAKFWEYLLDNLHAAVSEVFQTCENEKSINKCNVFIL